MTITNGHAAIGPPEWSSYNLTGRETQVLGLLVQGFSNRQMADSLGLKFYTVSTYVKLIYKKLGVHKRTGAVAKVLTERFQNGPALAPALAGLPATQTSAAGLLAETITTTLNN
jgi:DNA-binding NarL/FixJ family response regulator